MSALVDTPLRYKTMIDSDKLANDQTRILLVKIITKNIPKAWKTQFKLVDGHRAKTTIEAQKKLWMLEKEDKREKQTRLKEKEIGQKR